MDDIFEKIDVDQELSVDEEVAVGEAILCGLSSMYEDDNTSNERNENHD